MHQALFITILFLQVELMATQAITNADVCSGTNNGAAVIGSGRERYLMLKAMYTNCTYVMGNLEINSPVFYENETLDFLSNIREVDGYVYINIEKMPSLKTLPLRRLMIIRGESTMSPNINENATLSLFILPSNYITNLGLHNLREISKGSIYIGHGAKLCYGDPSTISWSDIKQSDDQTVTVYSQCADAECDESCNGYCWGPTADDCQKRNKEVCADQCEYRCYGNSTTIRYPSNCCHPECSAGCSGPTQNECWGCNNFFNDGTCVEHCPRSTVYNSQTSRMEINPNAKKSLGKLCVDECLDGYLEENEGCVLHRCSEGYTEVGSKCLPCNGTCPHDCVWDFTQDNYIKASDLEKEENQNCTVIRGNVALVLGSFLKSRFSDDYEKERAVNITDLEVFRNVRKITGFLYFSPAEHLPELTTLSIFSNLEEIGGVGVGPNQVSLRLLAFNVTSLEMTSLKRIAKGNVWLWGPMCYFQKSNFESLFEDPASTLSKNTKNGYLCDANSTCHSECRNSVCWGPTNTMCASGCANFKFDNQCVGSCSDVEMAFELDNATCGECHEECAVGCTGPTDFDCEECQNYRVGSLCVSECPVSTYVDSSNTTCLPCHEFCDLDNGCTGNLSTIGPGGCNACPMTKLGKVGDTYTVVQCLNVTAGLCPSSYFETSQQPLNLYLKYPSSSMCIPCYEECETCEASPYACTSCKNFEDPSVNSGSLTCVKSCRSNQYEDGKICSSCNNECKTCNGSTEYDCLECNDYRLYNVSDLFVCVSECPKSHPYDTKLNNIWQCSSTKAATATAAVVPPSKMSTAAIAVTVVVLILALVASVAIIVCVKRRQTRAKELKKRYYGQDAMEPLEPTNAEPDMSTMRLIRESELKRSVIIGSGAFGTVYKGYWVPEGESVKIPVAIKVLVEGTSPSMSTELVDEARVMASVDNPNCIKILALCMAQQLMLITQLMPEGSLLNYIKNHREGLGSKVLLNWCAQIAKGMNYLEERGVVHRDLAARNVLVQNENQVKITDFGLARLLDIDQENYLAQSEKLPIKWMALESIQHRIFNHQTDVWSYGVTIWEILSFGAMPYDRIKAREIAIYLENGQRLNQPQICTIDVYMIMIKCWMVDAVARPTFTSLAQEFSKMARDPARYLFVEGDELKRQPSVKVSDLPLEALEAGDDWNVGELDDKTLMHADEYVEQLQRHRYENEDAVPMYSNNANSAGVGLQLDNKTASYHVAPGSLSPSRYTSSPTLQNGAQEFSLGPGYPDAAVDDQYLEPLPKDQPQRPPVDEDGYLEPVSTIPPLNYVELLADKNGPSVRRKKYGSKETLEDESNRPLLSAENSAYMTSRVPPQSSISAHNPTYVSNNNGSPVTKQPVIESEYIN